MEKQDRANEDVPRTKNLDVHVVEAMFTHVMRVEQIIFADNVGMEKFHHNISLLNISFLSVLSIRDD